MGLFRKDEVGSSQFKAVDSGACKKMIDGKKMNDLYETKIS